MNSPEKDLHRTSMRVLSWTGERHAGLRVTREACARPGNSSITHWALSRHKILSIGMFFFSPTVFYPSKIQGNSARLPDYS